MGEWKEVSLGYVLGAKGYIRGPFGSALKRGEMKEFGVPVYEQKNAIYNSREFRFFIDETKFKEMTRFQVRTNDLIISCSGTVGRISIIREEDPKGIISQALLILRPDISRVSLKFLYYILSSKQGFEQITQASHGSVQINIAARNVVENIPILLPPLPEQKAIASVLSSLDDKIDLLHRQNKTLEAMSEALFRQWFVEEARDDWEETQLGNVVETTSGGTPSRKKMEYYENGIYDWVKSKELTGSFIVETEEKITEEALKNSSAKLLPKNSILIAMYGATVGEYSIITKEMTCNQAICALKPSPQYPYAFLFMLIKTMKEEIINMAVGSAQQNISQILIKQLPIASPNNIIIEFNEKTEAIFEKVKKNIFQIRTLEKLRDTLLPKLMSGEVRVKYEH